MEQSKNQTIYREDEVDAMLNSIYGINPERIEEFKKAIMHLGKQVPLDFIKRKIIDILKLSEVKSLKESGRESNADKAEVSEELQIISQGMNDNRKVKFHAEVNPEETHIGFLKSNLIPSFNDVTIAMEKIGNLLGVKMAKTYQANLENTGERTYIISQSVNENGEEFLMMNDFSKMVKEQKRAMRIQDDEKKKGDTTLEKIKGLINLPIRTLEDYSRLNGSCISEEEEKGFIDDYVKMICFDYITNQTDRNDGNYGVLINNQKVSFAPLIDSDYVLTDPSAENQKPFSLHKKYNKDDGLKALYELQPERVKNFWSTFVKNRDAIMEILQVYLSEDMLYGKGKYQEIITDNIRKFEELTKVKEKNSIQYLTRQALESESAKSSDIEELDRTETEIAKKKEKENGGISIDE